MCYTFLLLPLKQTNVDFTKTKQTILGGQAKQEKNFLSEWHGYDSQIIIIF